MSIRMIMLQFILLLSSAALAQSSAENNYLPTYNQDVTLTETNLPIVFIDLCGQTIPDKGQGEIAAHMRIIHNGDGQINYSDTVAYPNQTVDYDGWIEIKYRGNTSFDASEKKPYSITTLKSNVLPNDGGDKKKVNILGMGKDNKWAVIAPFADKVMFRDILSYELARPWMDFVPQARLCEFVINGIYYGIYAISERVSKGKDRLNLHDPGEDEGDLTGDYLVEIDRSNEPHYESKYHPWSDFDGNELTNITINYQYKSPGEEDFDNLPEGAMDELHNQIDQMEDAFAAENYTELYPDYIDVTSFIDYMLSTEISMNIDGYRLSTSLYKYSEARARNEGLDSRWKMSVWDYNIAWGNANYNDGYKTNEWQYALNTRKPEEGGVPFYWYKMVKDPAFMSQLKQRWADYRQSNYSDERIMATVDSLATLLTEYGAVERNNDAWYLLEREVWPNAYVGNSYENEINYLKDWIRKRLKFMDKQLLGTKQEETEPLEVTAGWNADVIAEERPVSEYTNNSIDGENNVFYSEALDEWNDNSGLPNDGIVVSVATDATYQLAPYDDNNCVMLCQEGDNAMVYFNDQFSTKGIYMLGTSGDGESELEVTVYYMEDTDGELHTVTIPDWYVLHEELDGTEARGALGRFNRSDDTVYPDNNFCLYDIYVPTNPDKNIYAIGLTQKSDGSRAAVFALSKIVETLDIILPDDDSNSEFKNSEIVTKYNTSTADQVTLKGRTLFKDNTWNTLTLPFSLTDLTGTPLEGATIKTLESSSYNDGTLTLNFSDNQTEVNAGTPYIVKWESGEDIKDPVFTKVIIDNNLGTVDTEAVTFEGFYSPYVISGINRKVLYMGADNTLYYPKSAMTIGACRALFHLKGDIVAGDVSSNTGAKVIVMNFGDETTSIDIPAIIDYKTSASETWFTVDGQRLNGKPAKKGVYIHNGKKTVVE